MFFVAFVLVTWWETSAPPRRIARDTGPRSESSAAYADLIQAFANELQALTKKNTELREEVKQLAQRVERLEGEKASPNPSSRNTAGGAERAAGIDDGAGRRETR